MQFLLKNSSKFKLWRNWSQYCVPSDLEQDLLSSNMVVIPKDSSFEMVPVVHAYSIEFDKLVAPCIPSMTHLDSENPKFPRLNEIKFSESKKL